ncbi:MAG: transposase, partial [Clostridiales bacterium]|nr:transposase [Clostridiales bacterium]
MFDTTVELDCSGYFQTWHGYRVSAIDGSRIALPAADAPGAAFGCQGPEKDAPTAQASIICDIYNQVAVDAEIDPLSTDESTMAERRLDSLSGKRCSAREPAVFDRGYPSFDLIHKLVTLGFTYVMRAPKNFNQDAAAQKEGDGR